MIDHVLHNEIQLIRLMEDGNELMRKIKKAIDEGDAKVGDGVHADLMAWLKVLDAWRRTLEDTCYEQSNAKWLADNGFEELDPTEYKNWEWCRGAHALYIKHYDNDTCMYVARYPSETDTWRAIAVGAGFPYIHINAITGSDHDARVAVERAINQWNSAVEVLHRTKPIETKGEDEDDK